jgi:nitrogenase molybdenum-iron protein alpha/beta subunit
MHTFTHILHLLTLLILKFISQSPLDKTHKIRLAIGSGLRTDIWKQFEKRYGIPWIIEYFGTTEGTAALMNLENKLGACGRLSPFLVCLQC